MDIKELNVETDKLKQNHPWEFARCKVVFSILNKYIKAIAQPQTIIDIGCGDIFFLNHFHKKFSQFKSVAVDTAFNEELIQQLSSTSEDKRIEFYKNISDVSSKDNASIVFLMDVIEHIENDVLFLQDVRKQAYINTNTLFLITVPAFNSLYCSHDKWLGHYRRYSQKSLIKTITKAGYQYIDGGYFFLSLIPPRFIQKIIEKIRPQKIETVEGIGNWTGGKLKSKFYEFILLCDYYCFKFFHTIKINIPGLSTYILCKPLS